MFISLTFLRYFFKSANDWNANVFQRVTLLSVYNNPKSFDMMRTVALFFVLVCIAIPYVNGQHKVIPMTNTSLAPAQVNGVNISGASTTLSDWYVEKIRQDRIAMGVLTTWGGVSALSGTALTFNTDTRDFGIMTLSWGLINAGIGLNAIRSLKLPSDTPSHEKILREEALFMRILAVNTGLNVAYIVSGLALPYIDGSQRGRQFGNAIIVQGAFLLAFDAFLLYNSSRRFNRLTSFSNYPLSLNVRPSLHHSSNYDYPIPVINIKLGLR